MIVYVYTFPNGKKYVGQSINSLEERAGNNGSKYKKQFVYHAIKYYGWDNIQKEIFECETEEEMDTLEQELIAIYHSNDRKFGYNLDGGGNKNKHLSEETKQKIGKANLGRHPSEETKKKISEAKKGEKNPMFGKKHSEETISKMRIHAPNSKQVICIETKQIYPSAAAAARALDVKAGTDIQNVCNKKPHYITAYGFHWAWLEDYEKEENQT